MKSVKGKVLQTEDIFENMGFCFKSKHGYIQSGDFYLDFYMRNLREFLKRSFWKRLTK